MAERGSNISRKIKRYETKPIRYRIVDHPTDTRVKFLGLFQSGKLARVVGVNARSFDARPLLEWGEWPTLRNSREQHLVVEHRDIRDMPITLRNFSKDEMVTYYGRHVSSALMPPALPSNTFTGFVYTPIGIVASRKLVASLKRIGKA